MGLKQQENENRKALDTARKNSRKKQEMSAIKTELGQNETKDAIKIVKSVLDTRHKEELAQLEDRYGAEREQLLIDCPKEERIKVLSDWEYRMNCGVVKLKQTHYDELIQYLEQVAPTTAETIRENNE